ncbi:SCO3870 family protein [Streptomyces lincolnensis]|uniref:SCO3870 family protein n=1 Tax=Streptomyces lincolnensis TaxID=1915 RepID=UPI000D19F4CB|nr:SCO3870 family protein [Streptomyces lincolnensis]
MPRAHRPTRRLGSADASAPTARQRVVLVLPLIERLEPTQRVKSEPGPGRLRPFSALMYVTAALVGVTWVRDGRPHSK